MRWNLAYKIKVDKLNAKLQSMLSKDDGKSSIQQSAHSKSPNQQEHNRSPNESDGSWLIRAASLKIPAQAGDIIERYPEDKS